MLDQIKLPGSFPAAGKGGVWCRASWSLPRARAGPAFLPQGGRGRPVPGQGTGAPKAQGHRLLLLSSSSSSSTLSSPEPSFLCSKPLGSPARGLPAAPHSSRGPPTSRQGQPGRVEGCSGPRPQCCHALPWGFAAEEPLALGGSPALAFSPSEGSCSALPYPASSKPSLCARVGKAGAWPGPSACRAGQS